MNILTMLPQNSGIAMQESAEQSVELYILTDSTWAKGEYILTCAVYSQNDGLVGLEQGIVEVV
jgi:methanogen extracellular protein (TIGR04279 family)